ncbi:hypothetical protein CAPTEDRAFT_97892 [Capitella teleta]|uniref:Uncharacterized protein n=1 Tax=Capitella teleta TaxID=283909 RepID=R7UC47_CAPTE|nr:hypothetical protein CAPTEDRAFT_97892 [Capitella teleta]|eukprot:ELU01368.1 hypothetical protein CAPTEDRAFT_97892 [Capitella teleta]
MRLWLIHTALASYTCNDVLLRYITALELHETLNTLGEVLTKEEADNMMMEADANGDGRIDYEGKIHSNL